MVALTVWILVWLAVLVPTSTRPPAVLVSDLRRAEDLLVTLASRYSDSIDYPRPAHELETFDNALQTVRQASSFEESTNTILCAAFRYYNFDFVTRFLAAYEASEKALEQYSSVLGDAIKGYGALDPTVPHFHNDVVGAAEGVVEGVDLGEMITLLMQHGAASDGRDVEGKSALFHALNRGFDKAFNILLAADADPSERCLLPTEDSYVPTKDGIAKLRDWPLATEDGTISLLQHAFQRLQAHRYLIDRATSLNWQLAPHIRWPGMVMTLLRLGLDFEVPNEDKQIFFVTFCHAGVLEDVQLLSNLMAPDLQASVDIEGHGLMTALHAAALSGNPDIVRLLLEAGADPNVTSTEGDVKSVSTPIELIMSSQYDYLTQTAQGDEICDLLLASGASMTDGQAILMNALKHDRVDRVARLLSQGYRLSYVPLLFNTELIDLLFAYGSTIDVPLFLDLALGRKGTRATEEPSLSLLKYLQSNHGAKIDSRYFGDIAHYLLAAGTKGMGVLEHLLEELEYNVDSTFPFFREHREAHSTGTRDPIAGVLVDVSGCTRLYSFVGYPEPEPGEQTNLLQLTCRWNLVDAARGLLERGADVHCPGLPESAITLLARVSGDDWRRLPLKQLLLEYDQTN